MLPQYIIDRIEKEAEKNALIAAEPYCVKDNHSFDCNCDAYEMGYKKAATTYEEKAQILLRTLEDIDEMLKDISYSRGVRNIAKSVIKTYNQ